MGSRKVPLVANEIYHIYTRSISQFNIFRSDTDYQRVKSAIYFYCREKPEYKFSALLSLNEITKNEILAEMSNAKKLVDILGYCIMPTHLHIILKQLKENGISKFMNLMLKSYSRYFNLKYNRLGPLCEARFKNVLVETDEQLLHLTRYIHLNPVSQSLVKKPQEWKYSSYLEYLGKSEYGFRICNFESFIDIMPENYEQFVSERIDEQRELEKIKHLTIE